jgi:hypothetical protein
MNVIQTALEAIISGLVTVTRLRHWIDVLSDRL